MRRILLDLRLAAALVIGALPGFMTTAGAQGTNDTNAVIPLLEMNDVRLTDAIRYLAGLMHLNYILDPRVADPSFASVGTPGPEPRLAIRLGNTNAQPVLSALRKGPEPGAVGNPATSVAPTAHTNQPVPPAASSQTNGDTNKVTRLVAMERPPPSLGAVRPLGAHKQTQSP